MSTEATVARLMALADEFAESYLSAPVGAVAQMRAALEAALREALDPGEPLARVYIDDLRRAYHLEGLPTEHKLPTGIHNLYAAPKDKP